MRLKELGAAGFNHNPFLIDVCKVLETRLLSNVKWKARIELKKGVYLMGEYQLVTAVTHTQAWRTSLAS